MRLDRRLDRLEGILQPQAAEPWTTWEQDRFNADLFHCRQTGEVARWDELARRPHVTILEYSDNYEGMGEPARIMHQPGGVTRVLGGVGRDEGTDKPQLLLRLSEAYSAF